MRRWLAILATSIALTIATATGVIAVHAAPAQADDCAVEDFPFIGTIDMTHVHKARYYSAIFTFELYPEQLEALQCQEDYLEIDFALDGFVTAPEEQTITTDLPGAIPDTPVSDDEPRPSITNIKTVDLEANTSYQVKLELDQAPWSNHPDDPNKYNGHGAIRISWQPSYWADPFRNPAEAAFCAVHGNQPEFCIFGNNLETTVFGNKFFSHPDINCGWIPWSPNYDLDHVYALLYDHSEADCQE